jgi:hypothetical protein
MTLVMATVVATRKCHINCNETLSPPCRLSNGGKSGSATEVVDAGDRGFSFLRRGNGSRAAFGVFLEGQGQGQGAEKLVSAKDVQRAIELMGEFDGFASVSALAGQGRQGDGECAQGEGVIGADDALVTQAEAASEIEAARQGAEVGHGFGGGARETLVVVEAEPGQYGVGLLQGGGMNQAEFADQAVLTGAPDAFDAALGLGRVGGDLLDAEFVERASELRGRLLARQLFGPGPVGIVAREDTVTIAVEAERDAVGGDHGVQDAQVADSIFGFELKVSGEDLAGGVVLKSR